MSMEHPKRLTQTKMSEYAPTQAGTPLYARAGVRVHLVHLSIPGRLGVYEVVGDGWQLNVINAHVPFGDATEPFLQALSEAYRQMAMLSPTIIIGNMNATPNPADRGGQATPQNHALRDTIEMLGLVDLTANHPTSPTKQMPPPPASTYAMATLTPSSGRRPDTGPSRWDPQAIAPCISASPSPTFPPAPERMLTRAYHPP